MSIALYRQKCATSTDTLHLRVNASRQPGSTVADRKCLTCTNVKQNGKVNIRTFFIYNLGI